jgi:predicted dehydrogenase
MKPLRFAIFGAGFWANYQLPAWLELPGVECVAIYNRTLAKAEKLAERFGITGVYDDAEKLIASEELDFIDIITDVETHTRFVDLAVKHRLPVICQKPMARTLREAEAMVSACERARVPFFVHENWRWQAPMRQLRKILKSAAIGRLFRARIDMVSGFPVFKNQPFLRELKKFIIADLGSHTLDTARFLFGEATELYCHTARVHKDIKGEDVATVMMKMGNGVTVTCNMAYAENFLERDRFPETYFFVEGAKGSIEVGPDYWIRTTTKAGTHAQRCLPPRYSWADPAYDVVHASIVPCHANILGALRGQRPAETTGEDNLKTVRLVFAAYDSAGSGRAVRF